MPDQVSVAFVHRAPLLSPSRAHIPLHHDMTLGNRSPLSGMANRCTSVPMMLIQVVRVPAYGDDITLSQPYSPVCFRSNKSACVNKSR